MSRKVSQLATASGMLVLPWLLVGVAIAISLNSDFQFPHDVLSKLGASDSQTKYISPAINNFPIGVLFVVFGARLTYLFSDHKLGRLSGGLVVLHGVASIIAGVFSCDPGCPIFTGSFEQLVHTASGVVMFASLIVAAGLWYPQGLIDAKFKRLGSISLACAILSFVLLLLALAGHLAGAYAGLFELLSYGVLCGWCFFLSYEKFLNPQV